MDYGPLQRELDYSFAQPALLLQALTHRSHSTPHNERLEFLGDSILNCCIANELYRRFGDLKEGELSRLRANLVKQDALAGLALRLQLGTYLRLGEGELKSGGSRRPSILADTVEALIGAVFLDGGFGAAQAAIAGLYADLLDEVDPTTSGKDPKTLLQELMQGRRIPLPVYSVVATLGAAHNQSFEVECRIPQLSVQTSGHGFSRRMAEQEAARLALERIGKA